MGLRGNIGKILTFIGFLLMLVQFISFILPEATESIRFMPKDTSNLRWLIVGGIIAIIGLFLMILEKE
jgi:nitrate reductase gamma subunit